MADNTARINSPDVIKEFRSNFIKYLDRCRQSVSGVKADCDRAAQWVKHDQAMHWKMELRKAEELVRQTKSAYLLARHGSDYLRKPSYQEEEKALKRAERRKEEAQHKLEAIKRWSMLLEQQTDKLMGPIDNLSGMIDAAGPKALSRLEIMIRSLEDYLRETGGGGKL
jgi:hypothetical protein